MLDAIATDVSCEHFASQDVIRDKTCPRGYRKLEAVDITPSVTPKDYAGPEC